LGHFDSEGGVCGTDLSAKDDASFGCVALDCAESELFQRSRYSLQCVRIGSEALSKFLAAQVSMLVVRRRSEGGHGRAVPQKDVDGYGFVARNWTCAYNFGVGK
jgi:hypothetical protein